jgi:RNA polymerase-binding transcription factor DksA|tara:strand:- start:90 stop:680 length:591 start_codon:yes stop_codon:yes gene_type:complete
MKNIHKDYIEKMGKYYPKFYNVKFYKYEIDFLKKWYYWIDGLINEKIPPLNKTQKKFIKNFKTFIKNKKFIPNNQDLNDYGFSKKQKIWIKYFFVKKYKSDIFKFDTSYKDSIIKNVSNLKERRQENLSDISGYNQKIKNYSSIILKKKKDIKVVPIINSTNEYVNCIKCGNKFPLQRRKLGYEYCINCSTENFKY